MQMQNARDIDHCCGCCADDEHPCNPVLLQPKPPVQRAHHCLLMLPWPRLLFLTHRYGSICPGYQPAN